MVPQRFDALVCFEEGVDFGNLGSETFGQVVGGRWGKHCLVPSVSGFYAPHAFPLCGITPHGSSVNARDTRQVPPGSGRGKLPPVRSQDPLTTGDSNRRPAHEWWKQHPPGWPDGIAAL